MNNSTQHTQLMKQKLLTCFSGFRILLLLSFVVVDVASMIAVAFNTVRFLFGFVNFDVFVIVNGSFDDELGDVFRKITLIIVLRLYDGDVGVVDDTVSISSSLLLPIFVVIELFASA